MYCRNHHSKSHTDHIIITFNGYSCSGPSRYIIVLHWKRQVRTLRKFTKEALMIPIDCTITQGNQERRPSKHYGSDIMHSITMELLCNNWRLPNNELRPLDNKLRTLDIKMQMLDNKLCPLDIK